MHLHGGQVAQHTRQKTRAEYRVLVWGRKEHTQCHDLVHANDEPVPRWSSLGSLDAGSGQEIPVKCLDTGMPWWVYPCILVLAMGRFQSAISLFYYKRGCRDWSTYSYHGRVSMLFHLHN